MDMGWYYLNVSRLQNAADAAAIAGANTLKTNEDVKNVKKVLLVDEYVDNPANDTNLDAANASAAYYADKNLNETAESADAADTETPAATNAITNSWTNGSVTPAETLYKDADEENYYYHVTLSEDIKHFMMPGWFNDMPAKVDAVAKLSTGGTNASAMPPPDPVDPKVKEALETAKNYNVIIGNWEVQNYYRQNKIASEKEGRLDDLSEFKKRFGFDLYLNAWNMFSDLNIHYKNGNLYRTEKIMVLDDVVLKDDTKTGADRYKADTIRTLKDENGNDLKDENGKVIQENLHDSNMESFGTVSSVHQTKAASNGWKKGEVGYKGDYLYNTPGNPYVAEDLDSIDIDFQAEVGFPTSQYAFRDWDLQLGHDAPNNRYADGSGNTNIGVGKLGKSKYGWHDHLRIHSTIIFDKPYPERERYQKTTPTDRDILWVRIESEPMLNKPDASENYTILI